MVQDEPNILAQLSNGIASILFHLAKKFLAQDIKDLARGHVGEGRGIF